MSTAALMAGVAGASAVAGAWEMLGTVERPAPSKAIGRLLAPLRRAGITPTRAEHRRLVRTAAAALLLAGWLLSGPLTGMVCAAGGPWLVNRLVARRDARWRSAAATQAPVVARTLADALSGGHSVRGALAQVARHGGIGGPAGAVLDDAARMLAAGEQTERVLEHLRTTVVDPAWDTLVAAILLARETGGDLAGLLRSLAGASEQARRDEADARAATAQARLTATIVAALPLGAAALAELADPGLLPSLLTDPRSAALLAVALVTQVGALLLVRRIARVAAT